MITTLIPIVTDLHSLVRMKLYTVYYINSGNARYLQTNTTVQNTNSALYTLLAEHTGEYNRIYGAVDSS